VILPRANSGGNMLHSTSSDVLAMLSSTAGNPTGTKMHPAYTVLMSSVILSQICIKNDMSLAV